MFGKNIIRKQDLSSPDRLAVQSIFKTIQGEGPLAGIPAIFIRLAGCNLKCIFCDTEFESGINNLLDIDDIVREAVRQRGDNNVQLIVISGGEPLRQDITLLIGFLLHSFKHVQIEMAGTLWMQGLDCYIHNNQLSLVCSPKTPKVHGTVAIRCTDWKYIIKHGGTSPKDGLPIMSTQSSGVEQELFRPPGADNTIWVQACDEYDEEKNKLNLAEAIRVSMKYGYRLSFQMHKALGLE